MAPPPSLQPPPGEGGKVLPLALELAGLGHTEPPGPPHLVHASSQTGPNPRAHTPAGRCGRDFKGKHRLKDLLHLECRAVADNGGQTQHLWQTNGRICCHQVFTTRAGFQGFRTQGSTELYHENATTVKKAVIRHSPCGIPQALAEGKGYSKASCQAGCRSRHLQPRRGSVPEVVYSVRRAAAQRPMRTRLQVNGGTKRGIVPLKSLAGPAAEGRCSQSTYGSPAATPICRRTQSEGRSVSILPRKSSSSCRGLA